MNFPKTHYERFEEFFGLQPDQTHKELEDSKPRRVLLAFTLCSFGVVLAVIFGHIFK